MKRIESNRIYTGITLSEVKKHLRITHDLEDTSISAITNTAYHIAEDYIFSKIAITDVQEITNSYTGQWYRISEANIINAQDFSGYTVTVDGVEVDVIEVYQEKFSTVIKLATYVNDSKLIVSYQAGLTDLPLPIKQAILVKVGELFDMDRSGYTVSLSKSNLFELLLNNYISLYA
tara:strand:+ start:109 stop:636 length:528 start_codon:yes stop_codon:yes gene_type:complete